MFTNHLSRRLLNRFLSRFFTAAFVLAFLAIATADLCAQTGAETVVFTHANIIDGFSSELIRDASLVVSAGKITEISTDAKIPEGAKVIDLKGQYLLPGLIDAHVHIRTFDAAKRALHSGVTTARSMGVSHFADVGMRQLAAEGKIEAPEILAAGYHVRPKLAETFFIDEPEFAHFLESEVHGPEALRKIGETMIAHRVDWLKTNATARAGLPDTDPRQPYYNETELKALVEVGAKKKIPVAAHAHGDEGGRAAVLAGVRSIEHGTYLSQETLAIMAKRGTFLVPTIAVVSDVAQPGGDYDNPFLQIRGRHMLPRIRQTAAWAHKLKVKLVAATDTGYGPNSTLRLSQELEELVGIGLSALQAIQAATTVAAELLGVDDHTGRIAAGFDADLIVVEQNPLENIGALHDMLIVMNNGEIVLNRTEW